ncbi:hypothetical protein [Thiocapsa bogorovii]|uniref:hypothetical protein n=1 Tax=Thiocapsa bogorovii TaxID=521689 RepID=UPI001E5FF96C|nr:hypothetical protein [Thiocapsa bogorovii]UHD15891.1 hypothetical protein LT988_21975 [Thiocapsa bogorovii]
MPVVARVRNAGGDRFAVRVQNPVEEPFGATYSVHYAVAEAGVYTLADDGIKMEAVRATSNQTNASGRWPAGNARTYAQSYASRVVLGQVMSENDPRWLVFWAR